MMAVYVGPVLTIVYFVGLFVFGAGISYEQKQHRPYCDCPKCVKWRAERKAEGEKRDGASDSNF